MGGQLFLGGGDLVEKGGEHAHCFDTHPFGVVFEEASDLLDQLLDPVGALGLDRAFRYFRDPLERGLPQRPELLLAQEAPECREN